MIAMDRNKLVGRGGQMPWHIPGEMAYFKSVTMGKPIIMGRKTYDSIGRPLPGRPNIVATRNSDWTADCVHVATGLDDALTKATIPKALIKQGHRDILRLSDARMPGTPYGACVLHLAPESYIGGPLALLKTGDIIRLDLPARKLDMLVDEEEMTRCRAAWTPPAPRFARGWGWMYSRHVTQADKGCDFDFLEPDFGKTAG